MKISNGRGRSRHRSRILSQFRPGRGRSRLELARETGLSAATVSRITRELVRGKVLREVRRPGAAPGRPSAGLEINGASGAVLGISLLYPLARIMVLDLRGDLIRQGEVPIAWNRGVDGLLGPVKRAVSLHRRGVRLAGVGLALPGQWDPESGTSVMYPRIPEWKNVPVRRLFEEWTRVPASLIGYAPAMALAEQARRPGREPRNLVCVEVAENVAMGAIVNGGVVEGASGNAGELGHIPIDPGGPVCYCGATGCLETRATVSAVLEELRESEAARGLFPDPRRVVYGDVFRRAQGGDSFCSRLLGRAARTLGMGLATALNLFNPELLVLNGRFFEAGDLVLNPLRAAVQEHALGSTMKRLSIERSTLGPSASALGAGLLAVREAVRGL